MNTLEQWNSARSACFAGLFLVRRSPAASLHSALGQSYLALGDLDAAERQFNAALDLHIKASGGADPTVAADRADLDRVAKARAR